jgi:hypothetical protein
MKTKSPPCKVWVHKLQNGKYSFSKYIRATRTNIRAPFKLDDRYCLEDLQRLIVNFKIDNSREIEFVDDRSPLPIKIKDYLLGITATLD